MASEYLKWKYRDVKPDEPPPPPTGWDKVKNWFSYNWYWLAAGAVILAILGSILWTALGIGKTRPDYILAYVGRGELPEQTREALIAAVQRLGTDVNGDGEIYVELHSYATAETSVRVPSRSKRMYFNIVVLLFLGVIPASAGVYIGCERNGKLDRLLHLLRKDLCRLLAAALRGLDYKLVVDLQNQLCVELFLL